VLAACGEDQPTTAPAEPERPAFDQTTGHKVVNSLADPGNGICNATQCTLREAINDPQSTEISFAPGLTGTIALALPGAGGGRLEIDKQLTITGPSQRIVIRGRAPNLTFPVFRIGPEGRVTLTNLVLKEGGNGIINRGTTTLINSVVTENSSSGIFDTGHRLELIRSRVVDNAGAGIFTSQSTAVLTNTRIAGNSGSGLFVFTARATLIDCTIAGNSVPDYGGGISIRDGSVVTVTGTTVSGNSAGRRGGGIANRAVRFGRLSVSLTLINSVVSGNSAEFGGGIFNENLRDEAPATLALTNSTVARNSATQGGGGIELLGDGDVALTNSLVAQNRAPTAPDFLNQLEEAPVTARFNLIGNGAGSGITNSDGNQVGSPSAPIDPKLGPLADNGGPTKTHALLSGSPAIDAASTPDCPATDQRGVLRPQGAACDIGSYERK
jgi:CSLREA domain-containing protein